jgi:hypothetical protein
MSKARAIAGSTWALSIALTATAIVLIALTHDVQSPSSYGFRGSAAVFVLAFGTVGAVVASRRPANSIGWIFCWVGLGNAIQLFGQEYGNYGLRAHPGSLPGSAVAASLSDWIYIPAIIAMVPLFLMLFPDGRLPSRRWRPVLWTSLVALPLTSLGLALTPGRGESGVVNPLGVHGALVPLVKAAATAEIATQISVLAGIAAVVVRYRRSRGIEREQFKWLAAAAVFLGITLAVEVFAEFGGLLPPAMRQAGAALTVIGFAVIPVALGFAVLRYRLYDIERIISRTVSYAIVTGLLVGGYIGLVVAFQEAARPITGRSDIAVAASTLIMAALFVPMRRRVQNVVDRRFNRHRYDAANTIEAFAARLRDEVDIDTLTVELKEIVSRTMQPSLVSVWLRSES